MAKILRAIKICQLKYIILFNSHSNTVREVLYLILKMKNPSLGELRDDSRPQMVSGRGRVGTLIPTSESVLPTCAKQEIETRRTVWITQNKHYECSHSHLKKNGLSQFPNNFGNKAIFAEDPSAVI